MPPFCRRRTLRGMGRTADRATIRPSRMALVPPSFVALSSFAYGSAAHWAFYVLTPIGLLGVLVVARTRTELTAEGVTTCDGLRVRHVPWSALASLTPRARGVAALTNDGARVPLPAVVWEGGRRDTAAFVAAWAAGRGRPLTLVEP
jgi:hypothetical protein